MSKKLGYLYLIKFFSKDEEFYKIGICTRGVIARYSMEKNLKYSLQVIAEIEMEYKKAKEYETHIKEYYYEYLYQPKYSFGGSKTECFSIQPSLSINKDYPKYYFNKREGNLGFNKVEIGFKTPITKNILDYPIELSLIDFYFLDIRDKKQYKTIFEGKRNMCSHSTFLDNKSVEAIGKIISNINKNIFFCNILIDEVKVTLLKEANNWANWYKRVNTKIQNKQIEPNLLLDLLVCPQYPDDIYVRAKLLEYLSYTRYTRGEKISLIIFDISTIRTLVKHLGIEYNTLSLSELKSLGTDKGWGIKNQKGEEQNEK